MTGTWFRPAKVGRGNRRGVVFAMSRFRAGPVSRLTLVMSCAFAGLGVSLPFMSRWLESVHGLNGVEIALVVSSAQISRIVVGPLIAAWADGFTDRRMPLRILSVLTVLFYAAYFTVDGFWALAIASFCAQSAGLAMTPLIEGAILRRAAAGGAMPYGVARGIGSVAFILSNVLGGLAMARFGVETMAIWLFASMSLACLSAMFGLKPDPVSAPRPGEGFRARLKEALRLFRRPTFAIPVAAASLIQCSHAFYYGFGSLVWARQGMGDDVIGWLWGVGVAVEVALLWSLPRFERRFSPEVLIAIGGAGGLLRWTAMAFSPPLALLWPLQSLHALSFAAAHVGALRLVQREAPEHIAGVAQTLYAALASGTVAGLAALLAGALYDQVGAHGYLGMAVLSGAGLAVLVWRGGLRGVGVGATPA